MAAPMRISSSQDGLLSQGSQGMMPMRSPSESGMSGVQSLPQPVLVDRIQSGMSGMSSMHQSQQGVAALDALQGVAAQQASAGQAGTPSDRSFQQNAGYFQTSEMRAAAAYGFGGEQGADVDVTVMAYAQWLSEMKQQATNSRYQQQAELDLMRDAINANNGELVDFKRHSSQVVHQLQGQVTELRARLSDALAEMAQQSRQRSETEQRINSAVSGMQQSINTRQQEHDASGRTFTEQLDRVKGDFDMKMVAAEGNTENLKRALASSQDATIMKFGEMDKAMGIFHGNITGTKQELTDTREDWKKSQDLLGQAISTLSQDLADFQKHASTVMNKLQSDAYHFEEIGRDGKDRAGRIEAQLNGLQQNIYSTTNELILLKDEKGLGSSPSQGLGSRTPQHPIQPPHASAAHLAHLAAGRLSPRNEPTSMDGSARFTDRNESSGTIPDMGLGVGAGSTTMSPQAAGLRPQAMRQSPMVGHPSAPNSGQGSLRSPQQPPGVASNAPSRSPSGSIIIPTGGMPMPARPTNAPMPGHHHTPGMSGTNTPTYSQHGAPGFQRSPTPPQVVRMPGGMMQ